MLIPNPSTEELGRLAAAVNAIRDSTVASVDAYNRTRERLTDVLSELSEEATTVSSMEGGMTAGATRPNRRADRKQQAPGDDDAMMQQQQMPAEKRPIEGRSLRNAGAEARLGPSLSGIDQAVLLRTLLPRAPIDGVDVTSPPGAVVASAMLDSAYQLK